MKKLICILVLACACAAQGAILAVPGGAVTTTSTVGGVTVVTPVANATVTWCTYQGSGIPCSPAATVYANQALTGSPTTNVGTTNAQGVPLYDGQQNIYAAAGTYIGTETGSGITSTTFVETISPQCVAGEAACTAKITAVDIVSLTSASPAITPTSIEKIQASDQFQWSSQSSSSISPGSLGAVTPAWGAVAPGIMVGAVSIASSSSTSATITRVSGDHWNPNWSAGMPVNIDGTLTTLSSCSSATSCTLAANAPRTSSYSWVVVGYPTPVYISGGTGTAESVDVLGIGASECGNGSALTICFWAANSHSGSYTLQSATDGAQEAVNAVENVGGGRVLMPAGSETWYAPVVVASNNVTLAGANQFSPHISTPATMAAYSGAATGIITALNVNDVGLQDFWISGPSAGGGYYDIALFCTTGVGGCGHDTLERINVDGANGTANDANGVSQNAAGIVLQGIDQAALRSVYGEFDKDGLQLAYNNGGAGIDITGGDFSFDTNGIEEITNSLAGVNIGGNHFYGNTGAGVLIDGQAGGSVAGNYFEASDPDILLVGSSAGLSIAGNELSQLNTSASTCIICGTAALNSGLHITGNSLEVNKPAGGSIDETALIDLKASGSVFDGNTATSSTTMTVAVALQLESGSILNRAGQITNVNPAQLTITTPINDLDSGYAGFGPYLSTVNATPMTFAGSGGLRITAEASSSDQFASFQESGGIASLCWSGHTCPLNFALSGTPAAYGATGHYTQAVPTPTAGHFAEWASADTLEDGGVAATAGQLAGAGSLTTTAASSDNVAIAWPDGGTRTPGHCVLSATNSSAAANIASTYISAKGSNQATVTHTATASMTYDVTCTVN